MEQMTVPLTFSMMGIHVDVKVSAEQSNNVVSVIEQVVEPGAGSPPHILHGTDKVIMVLEGEFSVMNGTELVSATSGTTVFIPGGTVHNFKNTGQAKGKIVVIVTPGGHEKFLYELSERLKSEKPSPLLMAEVGQKHHVEMVTVN